MRTIGELVLPQMPHPAPDGLPVVAVPVTELDKEVPALVVPVAGPDGLPVVAFPVADPDNEVPTAVTPLWVVDPEPGTSMRTAPAGTAHRPGKRYGGAPKAPPEGGEPVTGPLDGGVESVAPASSPGGEPVTAPPDGGVESVAPAPLLGGEPVTGPLEVADPAAVSNVGPAQSEPYAKRLYPCDASVPGSGPSM